MVFNNSHSIDNRKKTLLKKEKNSKLTLIITNLITFFIDRNQITKSVGVINLRTSFRNFHFPKIMVVSLLHIL